MKVSPCYKCKDHKFGCRPGCERWAEFEEAFKIEKEKIKENRLNDLQYKGWTKERDRRVNNYLKHKVKK